MARSLLGFLPWIAYAVVATSDEWRYGAILGLVIAVGVIVIDRRAGRTWDQMVIEVSAAAFFLPITVISFVSPDSPLMPYGPALVNAWLALTAWGSLAVRRPFTLGIARRTTPPEVWRTPLFLRVNVVITMVWGAAFTVAAVALAVLLHEAPHATAAVVAVKILSFAVPAVFTVRYPKAVAARHLRPAGHTA
ncbi:hypothetical protein GCM10027187_05120 [Streptosporangium sandarakinum]|uniref:Intracellular septation protein A n=1 Tax=Streptosporangium sandarakinum TaxID=1260955 RepID=A0A852V496_9ACTN|nr:hypothetical protein [Streptosporangium sandarakinum]NYF40725.1 hypothetical protein [Streptosporangium sandarakinum]